MYDPQSGQAGDGLVGQHGSTVVGHQGARQSALHERLRQAMNQALGGFVEIPLQVADQTRAVIDDAEQQGFDPVACAPQHLARGMMEIQMPQRTDVIDLEAADLQSFEPVAGQERPCGGAFRTGLAEHAAGCQIPPDRGIRRDSGIAAGQGGAQVVDVQLHGPAGMLAILGRQDVDGPRRETGEAADVVAQAVPQGGDWIGGRLGGVVPAFQGRDAEANLLVSERMTPGLGSQGLERRLQFARGRRGGQ